ncbi:hypothetical protein CSKR_100987 [Clonorchis sinensis]|uniref:Uncharacterized protein n=1 Tax=Clonorchis sinensis TaxID=79923 RepID=A0A419Q3Z6_CLOSI|nr:hypothetical protein CSKR_100987 [Clonorchis sinensis]
MLRDIVRRGPTAPSMALVYPSHCLQCIALLPISPIKGPLTTCYLHVNSSATDSNAQLRNCGRYNHCTTSLGNLAASQSSCFLWVAWQLGTERGLQLNDLEKVDVKTSQLATDRSVGNHYFSNNLHNDNSSKLSYCSSVLLMKPFRKRTQTMDGYILWHFTMYSTGGAESAQGSAPDRKVIGGQHYCRFVGQRISLYKRRKADIREDIPLTSLIGSIHRYTPSPFKGRPDATVARLPPSGRLQQRLLRRQACCRPQSNFLINRKARMSTVHQHKRGLACGWLYGSTMS